jgi:hypothetical protein
MKQILHIFLKDARRFWPEILVSLAVLTAFIRIYPHTWLDADRMEAEVSGFSRVFGGGAMGFLAGTLVVLVPITWWVLISRVIHAERLVGNTQFWLTRPYEWKKLLAAKFIFLAAFLFLPFFIAQSLLLVEAGFNPFHYLPGLLCNLACAAVTIVLPLVALSALTSSFPKLTLVILGIILFIAGVAALEAWLQSDSIGSVSGPFGDYISFLVILCGLGAAIVLQYATRKTLISWLPLISTAVLLSALALLDPDQALMNHTYPRPASGAAAPLQLAYNSDPMHQPPAFGPKQEKDLDITIPLRESNVADGYAVVSDAFQVTIEGPDGSRWQSSWQATDIQRFLPGSNPFNIGFRIRRAVYDKFKSVPVKLHIAFALTPARAGAAITVPVPAGDFSVPGFGVCSPQGAWFGDPRAISQISCRSALRQPPLTFATVLWTQESCPASGPAPLPDEPASTGVLGAAWAGTLDNDPAEFGITSVWQTYLPFTNRAVNFRPGPTLAPNLICLGSPLTVTQYHAVARTQADLDIPGFHLPPIAKEGAYALSIETR